MNASLNYKSPDLVDLCDASGGFPTVWLSDESLCFKKNLGCMRTWIAQLFICARLLMGNHSMQKKPFVTCQT